MDYQTAISNERKRLIISSFRNDGYNVTFHATLPSGDTMIALRHRRNSRRLSVYFKADHSYDVYDSTTSKRKLLKTDTW